MYPEIMKKLWTGGAVTEVWARHRRPVQYFCTNHLLALYVMTVHTLYLSHSLYG